MPIRATFYAVILSLFASHAWAEVIVVVSPDSRIERLSRATLHDIYLGRRSQLDSGEPVLPIDQREASAVHGEFYRQYLGQSPAQIKAYWAKLIFTGRGQPPPSVTSDPEMIEAVSNNPHTIGYLDADAIDPRVRVVSVE